MSLTTEQIVALLNKPQRRGGGGSKKPKIDYLDESSRNYEQWFNMMHHMLDMETGETLECSNPNCEDARPSHLQMVAEVLGVFMCRECFIGGYLLGPGGNQPTLHNLT